MSRIRTLIVDDEPLGRERLRTLLRGEPDVELVGECANGLEAVSHIDEQSPDLVFLDVQMPELDGFAVLESVGVERMPPTVFVTAYDQYALKAFEVHALDYLLKPFTRARFRKTLQRVRDHLRKQRTDASELSRQLIELLRDVRTDRQFLERLVVKSGGRVFFLRVDEIDWIEAAGNYLRLHVGQDVHLMRETMKGIETKLDPDRFVRIHRSIIVNTDRIRELQPWFHGEYVLILLDGTRLTSSRNFDDGLKRMLKNTV
ncbi:MAG TPA: LytTR family transcriptional regulator DNA-binding domain-containing protein [Gemmatimonadaceae bacterium]|nr:LytTR family transcriptional regulator DNA-binding domain-containing protein [Gemmatimonadaceae bacterium]